MIPIFLKYLLTLICYIKMFVICCRKRIRIKVWKNLTKQYLLKCLFFYFFKTMSKVIEKVTYANYWRVLEKGNASFHVLSELS